jgi:undecaprenyl diphosphate synthase
MPLNIPTHVAIIMDGNRRWAKEKNLPRLMGHKAGAEALRRVVKAACELNINYLTFFAFSSENWQRSPEEVADLMTIFEYYLENELYFLNDNNIKVVFIGNRESLSSSINDKMSKMEQETFKNTKLVLVLAVNYGSRYELMKAAIDYVEHFKMQGNQFSFDEKIFQQYLYTTDIPDPDLIIRTSGEQRLSNFLLWQAAYSEFYFTNVMWPDFDKNQLEIAVKDYQRRERRFGSELLI